MQVVIAEDLFLLRDGLIRLLEAYGFEVSAAVDNGEDFLAAVRSHRPDIAVVDVRLPPSFTDEGLRAALQARAEQPGLPILVLSQYVEQLYARELLADGAGAVGYLLKDRVLDGAQFTDAVKRVADGGTAMDPEVIARLLAHSTAAEGPLGRLQPARARGPVADGRGPLERRDRGQARRHRARGRQAHRRHLHQAGPATLRRRQPPRPGRPGLPRPLTRPGPPPGLRGLPVCPCLSVVSPAENRGQIPGPALSSHNQPLSLTLCTK